MYQIDFNKPIHVYFCGIGGVSMSGLAEILLSRGFSVSGSDRALSPVTENLVSKGIRVLTPQNAENITDDIDLAVFTAAIRPDNPEYVAVHAKQIPSLTRAELLGQIMKNYEVPIAISGTHGKTTTTSMISEMLLACGLDPTITIGGNLRSVGGNVRIGRSGYFVAEACEYTNSFLSFFPKIGVILNIDADHLDFFKDLADIRRSFHAFAKLLPENGALILNNGISDPDEITEGLSCRVITCGNPAGGRNADYSAENVTYDVHGCASYTLKVDTASLKEKGFDFQVPETASVTLGVPGEHNVGNSLAAIAAADFAGADRALSIPALASCHGADRRFQYYGERDGVTVIDDYAHHPTEIRATLKAALSHPHRKLWVIFQPHTYSRTKALFNDFADALSMADYVLLAEIYAARETDTLGISSAQLSEAVRARGTESRSFSNFDEIEQFVLKNCRKGDLLITMGAGNVDSIAKDLIPGS